MFSGIIETIGSVINISLKNGCKEFTIKPAYLFDDLHLGDSISVNGVCLTITEFTNDNFKVTVVPETLNKTNLDLCKVNDIVNLERSIKVGDRVHGHYVQAHVDGCGKILSIEHDQHSAALLVKISIPKGLEKYIINKGYISLDGMSITIIEAAADWFTVTFIPHTQEATIIKHYAIGTFINIEVDMIGKYIEKILGAQHANTN